MKLILATLLCSTIYGGGVSAQEFVTVKGEGETVVSATSISNTLVVRLRTHEINLGGPGKTRPAKADSNCTYSRYPCSVVDGMDIVVNGAPLFVPRSAFCDLADLSRASLSNSPSQFAILLYGGNASEGYVVEIDFTNEHVTRRVLSSSISPDKPLQETKYYLRILGEE